MKTTIRIILFIAIYISLPLTSFSQDIEFIYDASGNCIEKYKTITLASHIKKGNSLSDSISSKESTDMIGDRTVTIYPNPTEGALRIEVKGECLKSPIVYFITDLSGKIFAQKQTYDLIYDYDMSRFASGVYLLRVVIDEKRKEWKIIKK